MAIKYYNKTEFCWLKRIKSTP